MILILTPTICLNLFSLSDAPALTNEQDSTVVSNSVETTEGRNNAPDSNNKDWDDETASTAVSAVRSAPADSSAAVLDMKTHGSNAEAENIAEKLRVEATKKQLAAAREGMEREALKLKEEREKEKGGKRTAPTVGTGRPMFSHLRGAGAGGLSRTRLGATSKLDTQDQELFPDLASASKILEKKEKDNKPVFKVAKKTPVGGGASWASKMKATPPTPTEAIVDSPAPAPEGPVQDTPAKPPKETPAPAPAPAPRVVKKATKKKKKDLSTFKPGA